MTCFFSNMTHHQVQQHFPPPTSQFRFSPEHIVDPPAIAFRMAFSSEGPLTAPLFPSSDNENSHHNGHMNDTQGISSAPLQKPKGEWNRPSKGYTLAKHCSETLGWGMGKFAEVKVGHI
jgi:hypothetical protein